jgi:alpha-tubulin suppressor-like RCC1 family protein
MAGNYSVQGADLDKFYMPTTTMIDKYVQTGSLWVWGKNTDGQLGDNTLTHRSSPVQTVAGGTNWRQVSSSGVTSFGIKTDGTLWGWGANYQGMIGDNTRVAKSSPVQTVAGGTNWKQISAARNAYKTSAIKTDGTLWGWGINTSGELGDGTLLNRSSPVQTVAGGNNWKTVSMSSHTGAIKTDGTLWLWGSNVSGNIGDNSTITRSSPVQTISGGNNWSQIAVGGGFNTAAIKTDGTLWVWGDNFGGALGDNTIIHKSSPVQTISGGTNWKSIFPGGYYNFAAIKTNGTLWIWGVTDSGVLGDNSNAAPHKSSPVQTVAGGTNWRQVSVGIARCSAIKTDGTLWVWGDNTSGALGDNTTISRSSPIQTIAGGTNWKQAEMGNMALHFYDAYNLYPK